MDQVHDDQISETDLSFVKQSHAKPGDSLLSRHEKKKKKEIKKFTLFTIFPAHKNVSFGLGYFQCSLGFLILNNH